MAMFMQVLQQERISMRKLMFLHTVATDCSISVQ